MYIKMEYIQKELANKIEQNHIINESFLLSFKLYESSIQEFEENILYLCMPADLSDKVKKSIQGQTLNFMIFCKEECDLPYLENSNYLFLRADLSDIFSYVNQLGDIFHRYNNWEQKLLALLTSDGSYQEAIDIGNEMITLPMAMMDINHQILAVTKDCEQQDTLLFSLSHGYGYHFLNIINRSNPTLEEVGEKGMCEVISSISGNRLRVYKIRKDAYTSFFIGFHKADKKEYHPADICLFDFFVAYLEQLVSVYEKNQSNKDSDFALFMEELILNPEHSADFLKIHMDKFHLDPNQTWQILCIKFTNFLQFRTTYHYEIMNQIRHIINGCHCALINSNIAVLVDGSTDLSACLSMLQYLLITNDAVCACSSTYMNLDQTRQVWNQLQFILDKGQPKNGSNILFYKDYYKEHCLFILHEEFPEQTLYHSALYKIQEFDIQNHTDYLPTLICYLQNNCSMNATADILEIHRNSLLYRIRKIEELLGFEIADSEERIPMLFSSFLIQNQQKS